MNYIELLFKKKNEWAPEYATGRVTEFLYNRAVFYSFVKLRLYERNINKYNTRINKQYTESACNILCE